MKLMILLQHANSLNFAVSYPDMFNVVSNMFNLTMAPKRWIAYLRQSCIFSQRVNNDRSFSDYSDYSSSSSSSSRSSSSSKS